MKYYNSVMPLLNWSSAETVSVLTASGAGVSTTVTDFLFGATPDAGVATSAGAEGDASTGVAGVSTTAAAAAAAAGELNGAEDDFLCDAAADTGVAGGAATGVGGAAAALPSSTAGAVADMAGVGGAEDWLVSCVCGSSGGSLLL